MDDIFGELTCSTQLGGEGREWTFFRGYTNVPESLLKKVDYAKLFSPHVRVPTHNKFKVLVSTSHFATTRHRYEVQGLWAPVITRKSDIYFNRETLHQVLVSKGMFESVNLIQPCLDGLLREDIEHYNLVTTQEGTRL